MDNKSYFVVKNTVVKKFFAAFPALGIKNYRYYFLGQSISLIGTWLQIVAMGWLVLELTNSAFSVGLVAALGTFPVLIFALLGGAIADHFPRRNLIIFTQTSSMLIALILGILTISRIINLHTIYFLAFLAGIIHALDSPARQSFIIEMVGRENLGSAIALNSATFNSARIIGPALAGVIITLFGIGGSFLLNGLSFSGIIIALSIINVKHTVKEVNINPVKSIKEGLSFAYKNKAIKTFLILTVIGSIFGWSYATIMPYIVRDIFFQEASGLGIFYGAVGLGAVTSTILISAFSNRINPLIIILGGSFLSAGATIAFALISNIYIALPLLFLSGFGLIAQFATTNTVIQHMVPDHIRGRVMSIYTLAFVGMLPFGALQIGFLTEKMGVSGALILNSIIIIIFSVYVLTYGRNLNSVPVNN